MKDLGGVRVLTRTGWLSEMFSRNGIGLPLCGYHRRFSCNSNKYKGREDCLLFFLSNIAHSKNEIGFQIQSFTSLKHNVHLKIMILEGKINVGVPLFVFLIFQPVMFV